jgi:ankyrin repeat protein
MVKNYFYLIFLFFTLSSFAQKSSTIFDVARTGTVAEAKALFEQNLKVVDEINEAGYSPLILACYRGNTEVAQFLIENGANLNYNSTMGTPLMAAVVKGNIEIVNLLLAKNVDINQTDANGTTALIYAVQFKNVNLVKLLQSKNADKTKVDINGKTAFEYAVFSDSQEIINLLK